MSHHHRPPPPRAALTRAALDALLAPAVLRARIVRPYGVAVLLRLRAVDAPGLGTIAVRSDLVLLVDAEWFAARPLEEQAGLLLHECDHLLMGHRERWEAWSAAAGVAPDDNGNVAADLEINESQPRAGTVDAREAAACLPADGCFADTYPAPDGAPLPRYASMEAYAARLYRAADGGGGGTVPVQVDPEHYRPDDPDAWRPDHGQPGDGDSDGDGDGDGDGAGPSVPVNVRAPSGGGRPGGGTGTGTGPAPGVRVPTCGEGAGAESAAERAAVQRARDEGRYPEPDGTGAELELAREAVREAVRIRIRTHGRGSVPAHLARVADDPSATRPVPAWPRIVRRIVRGVIERTRAGRADVTYGRPSRRSTGGVLRPGWRGPRARLGVVVDTSGSMSDGLLARVLGEIAGVVRTVPGVILDVHACDTQVTSTLNVRDVRGVARVGQRLTGGGGTDLRVGIAAAVAQGADGVVVLTDGYTPWPTARPASPAGFAVLVVDPAQPLDQLAPSWATDVVPLVSGER